MREARLILTVTTALLLIGGAVQAQPYPYENLDLADVQGAFFWNFPKSGTSVVMATMSGGYGSVEARLFGARYGWTKNGATGTIAFELYEPDEIKRSGAGSWKVKQSDWVHMAFEIHTPFSSWLSWASPYFHTIYGLWTYSGAWAGGYPMVFVDSPSMGQIEGCKASLTTKDKNRNGLPESASWKASCNPKNFWWMTEDDQKLFKKVLKGLKGKGEFPAYYSYYY